MAWEEDYKHERPCFCGKGTIVSWSESDDWGRSRSGEYLTCDECKQRYVYAFVDPHGEALKKTTGYAWVPKERHAEIQKQAKEEDRLFRQMNSTIQNKKVTVVLPDGSQIVRRIKHNPHRPESGPWRTMVRIDNQDRTVYFIDGKWLIQPPKKH